MERRMLVKILVALAFIGCLGGIVWSSIIGDTVSMALAFVGALGFLLAATVVWSKK